MPTATLTSKGQITLPKAVRDRLRLQTGDTVEFVVAENGDIHVRAGTHDVRDLAGILKTPGQTPVSLAAMDAAIREGRRHSR